MKYSPLKIDVLQIILKNMYVVSLYFDETSDWLYSIGCLGCLEKDRTYALTREYPVSAIAPSNP
jgi:hypothetical protein